MERKSLNLNADDRIQLSGQLLKVIKTLSAGGNALTYLVEEDRTTSNTVFVLKLLAPKELRKRSAALHLEGNTICLQGSAYEHLIFQQAKETLVREYDLMNEINRAVGEGNNATGMCQLFSDRKDAENGLLLMSTARGMTLREWRETYYTHEHSRLRAYVHASVKLIQQLTSILKDLHKNGFLHLDLTPSNVWLYGDDKILSPQNIIGQIPNHSIALLDWGSCHKKSEFENVEYGSSAYDSLLSTISISQGFTSPAVIQYLHANAIEFSGTISESADLFSCAALLRYLVTGEGFAWKEAVWPNECFELGTQMAINKFFEAGKDFNITYDGLCETLADARAALSNRGIYASLALNASQQHFASDHSKINPDLLTGVSSDSVEYKSLVDWFEHQQQMQTSEPIRALLLNSEGGAGKTSQMYELWKYCLSASVIPLYIPLLRLDYEKKFPVLRYALSTYFPASENADNDELLSALKNLLQNDSNHKFIFLLDGWNELSDEYIIENDIEFLCNCKNVHVILSSRKDYRLAVTDRFLILKLLPLKENQINNVYSLTNVSSRMRDCLKNPMLLSLAMEMPYVYGKQLDCPVVDSAGELMYSYVETQCLKMRQDAADCKWADELVDNLAALATYEKNYHHALSFEKIKNILGFSSDNEVRGFCRTAIKYGLLNIVSNINKEFCFSHERWLEFFQALSIYRKIHGWVDKEDPIPAPHSELNSKTLSPEVAATIADLAKDYLRVPEAANSCGPSDIDRCLDLLRTSKEETSGVWKEVFNLISIMKQGRKNDLSCADLTCLDLTNVPLNEITFSRNVGDKWYTASVANSKISCTSFFPFSDTFKAFFWKNYIIHVTKNYCITIVYKHTQGILDQKKLPLHISPFAFRDVEMEEHEDCVHLYILTEIRECMQIFEVTINQDGYISCSYIPKQISRLQMYSGDCELLFDKESRNYFRLTEFNCYGYCYRLNQTSKCTVRNATTTGSVDIFEQNGSAVRSYTLLIDGQETELKMIDVFQLEQGPVLCCLFTRSTFGTCSKKTWDISIRSILKDGQLSEVYTEDDSINNFLSAFPFLDDGFVQTNLSRRGYHPLSWRRFRFGPLANVKMDNQQHIVGLLERDLDSISQKPKIDFVNIKNNQIIEKKADDSLIEKATYIPHMFSFVISSKIIDRNYLASIYRQYMHNSSKAVCDSLESADFDLNISVEMVEDDAIDYQTTPDGIGSDVDFIRNSFKRYRIYSDIWSLEGKKLGIIHIPSLYHLKHIVYPGEPPVFLFVKKVDFSTVHINERKRFLFEILDYNGAIVPDEYIPIKATFHDQS